MLYYIHNTYVAVGTLYGDGNYWLQVFHEQFSKNTFLFTETAILIPNLASFVTF